MFGGTRVASDMKELFRALVQKRDRRGGWVYVLWLVGYCTLAFIAIVYAAVLGQDYLSAFVFFVVPAVIGYVQFRAPTVLGWLVLLIPTALFGAGFLCSRHLSLPNRWSRANSGEPRKTHCCWQ